MLRVPREQQGTDQTTADGLAATLDGVRGTAGELEQVRLDLKLIIIKHINHLDGEFQSRQVGILRETPDRWKWLDRILTSIFKDKSAVLRAQT